MVNQYLTRADNDLSYFFWRAELYQWTPEEIDRGWQQLKQRIWDNCPDKPAGGQPCEPFEALMARWQSSYLKLKHTAQPQAAGMS